MSFDWAEFRDVAEDMLLNATMRATYEARCRTAISRAYYAAFCQAYSHLRDVEGIAFSRTADTHQEVRDMFWNSSHTPRQLVGSHLNTLRIHRNEADYRATSSMVDMFAAQTCLDLADEVLAALESL